eukprot:854048-Prymnesium_polylepis.1
MNAPAHSHSSPPPTMPTSYPTTNKSSPQTHTPAAQHRHGPCATSPPTPRTRSYVPARPNAP